MRPAGLVVLFLTVIAIAACGGEDDAAQAEETVSEAITGIAEGDAGKVCSKLTPAAEKKVLATLRKNPIGPNIRAKSCEDAVTKFHAGLSQAIRNALLDGEVEDAKLDGDKAVVHVLGAGLDVELRKRDGTWLITGGFFD